MRISDWSSDVCSSDLLDDDAARAPLEGHFGQWHESAIVIGRGGARDAGPRDDDVHWLFLRWWGQEVARSAASRRGSDTRPTHIHAMSSPPARSRDRSALMPRRYAQRSRTRPAPGPW